MIEYIQGILKRIEPSFCVVECQGIGYGLKISLHTYTFLQSHLNQTVLLHTHFLVREDAHILFGFADEDEKKLFQLLIQISGIGGNTALMILSGMNVSEFIAAVEAQEVAALKSIKGIGEKTAARVLLELKDKINSLNVKRNLKSANPHENLKNDAIQALIMLGLKKQDVEKRVQELINQGVIQIDQLIKDVLKQNLKR